MKQEHIELFYDFFDGIADVLYRQYKVPYLQGMNEAFRLLMDNTVDGEYSEEDMSRMQSMLQRITSASFEREEIRKSVQIGILKGYKHTYSSNSLITPDSIGLFLAYLIQKLYGEFEIETILDPLIGSGNLVYTIANQLPNDPTLYGVDNDLVKCKLARNLGDLLDYNINVFFQDSLTFYHNEFDTVVVDMPITSEQPYPPFQFLNHHIDSVKDGKFLFAVIENDFFEQPGSDIFKAEITKKAQVFGLIKLPEDLFTSHPKSILILRKYKEDMSALDGFLLVDLPSFFDQEGLQTTMDQMNQWIKAREDDLK